MNVPDLRALQQADTGAWDEAFRWLWPTAFAVAQLKLQPYLPEDIEDVAIEALEELVEKVQQVEEVEELKPLPPASRTIGLSAVSGSDLPPNGVRESRKVWKPGKTRWKAIVNRRR